MRIAVFSDVHGNLPAFEKMLKDSGKCDQYICLGDLVNYGPWSNECVDLALSLPNIVLLMGNHEQAFIEKKYPGDNALVTTFFEHCIKNFKREKEILNFDTYYLLNDYLFAHTIQNKYIYPDTDIKLNRNCVVGHSHHQFIYSDSGFTLYNVGSVGQNRKYINVINYVILESDSMTFNLKATLYDISFLIKEMKSKKYPQECLNYYLNKQNI